MYFVHNKRDIVLIIIAAASRGCGGVKRNIFCGKTTAKRFEKFDLEIRSSLFLYHKTQNLY